MSGAAHERRWWTLIAMTGARSMILLDATVVRVACERLRAVGRARARARQGREAKARPPKNPPKGSGPPKGAREGIRPSRVVLGLALGALWGLGVWLLSLAFGSAAVIGLLIFFVVACSLVGGATLAIMEGANARRRGEPLLGRRR